MKYKFYATNKLRDMLDDGVSDRRTENGIRSILVSRWMAKQGVNSLSIVQEGTGETDENGEAVLQDGEASYSSSGCECCSNGLGNDVYRVEGYSPKTKEVLELGDICRECLCIEYNGID